MNVLVSPSILNADFLHLSDAVDVINKSEADWLHLDIMDGIYVPNLTFGFPVISQIKSIAKKPLDVHLMIAEPDRHLERFKDAGADILTVHIETCTHLHRTIQHIHALGMKAGVALNPHTPVLLLKDILHDLDLVLIMTVNPGYGGQKFIEHSYKKISELKDLMITANPSCYLEVDGGVDDKTAPLLVKAGANVLVAGTYVFLSQDPVKQIKKLKDI
ncbi:MAG TPA: ribulose-phosphate 3-epimerase [Bacteroidales bacterium]|nr:ribulose-phosphate 3-epimerase [Bacteroidales bacterium]